MPVKRAVVESAATRILICDSSKYGKVGTFNVVSWDAIDQVITDEQLPQSAREALAQHGVRVTMAPLASLAASAEQGKERGDRRRTTAPPGRDQRPSAAGASVSLAEPWITSPPSRCPAHPVDGVAAQHQRLVQSTSSMRFVFILAPFMLWGQFEQAPLA